MADWALLGEFAVYLVTLSILAFHLASINPARPFMPLFTTTGIALAASSTWFSQSWDSSHESLITPWSDPLGNSAILFALAYMIADLPPLICMHQLLPYERAMFVFHHVFCALHLFCALYYGEYQKVAVLALTAEISNIFLNGRKVVPQGGLVKQTADGIFALTFLFYRLGYAVPMCVRECIYLFQQGRWFELFVQHSGTVFVGALHIWWTYLVLDGIRVVIVPPKQASKAKTD